MALTSLALLVTIADRISLVMSRPFKFNRTPVGLSENFISIFSKNKRKFVGLFLLFRKHANPLQYISITFLAPFQLFFQLIRLIFKIKI